MIIQANENNIPKKDFSFGVQGSKLWMGEDGIIQVKIGKTMTGELVKELIETYKGLWAGRPGRPKALVDMSDVPHTPLSRSSLFRKEIVKDLKNAAQDPGFEKAALFGGEILQKTVVKFILAASRLKHVKYFNNKEEALKWLNEK